MRLSMLSPLNERITRFWGRFQQEQPGWGRSLVDELPFQASSSEPLAVASGVLEALNGALVAQTFLPQQAAIARGLTQALGALQAAVPAGISGSASGLMSVGTGSGPSGRPDSKAPASSQLLVQWDPAASVQQRDAALALMGGTRVETIHTAAMQLFGRGVLEVIELPTGMTVEQGMQLYANRPGVVVAEPNYVLGLEAVSNDSAYTGGSLWGMYGDATTPANQFGSQAGEAWAAGYTGNVNTVMGVIDTGIDYTHPDLYLNIWLNPGEIPMALRASLVDTDSDGLITFRDLNHVSNSGSVADHNKNGRIDAGDLLNDARWENGDDSDFNGYKDDLIGWDFFNGDNDPYDDNQHGTHCAGTIGGIGGNTIGVAGVAWNTLLMPLKFLSASGSGATTGAIQAVDYYTKATQLYDSNYNPSSTVVFVGTSNSWGGGGSSSLLLSSIVDGARVGNLFVAAAGNSSSNNDVTSNFPSNYSTFSALGWEAVIAVASITSSGGLSSFSSYGATTVDLGAPGSSIYSTVPGGGYATLSGTSMATPHVGGALISLAAAYSTATPQELRDALYGGVVATSSLAGKTVTGGRLSVMGSLNWLQTNFGGGGGGGGGEPPPVDPSRIVWGTTGSDNLTGGAGGGTGADQITGVRDQGTNSADLGRGQVDKVTGGLGADTFLLADSRGNFYNDGNSKSNGTGDYLWVVDFKSGEDKLQLRNGSQYLYRNVSISGIAYTEIYLGNGDNRFNAGDELIARLQDSSLAPGTGVYVLGSQSWAAYV